MPFDQVESPGNLFSRATQPVEVSQPQVEAARAGFGKVMTESAKDQIKKRLKRRTDQFSHGVEHGLSIKYP